MQRDDADDYAGLPARVADPPAAELCPCGRNPIDVTAVWLCPGCQERLCRQCGLSPDRRSHDCRKDYGRRGNIPY
jgi:hypothetical protein